MAAPDDRLVVPRSQTRATRPAQANPPGPPGWWCAAPGFLTPPKLQCNPPDATTRSSAQQPHHRRSPPVPPQPRHRGTRDPRIQRRRARTLPLRPPTVPGSPAPCSHTTCAAGPASSASTAQSEPDAPTATGSSLSPVSSSTSPAPPPSGSPPTAMGTPIPPSTQNNPGATHRLRLTSPPRETAPHTTPTER